MGLHIFRVMVRGRFSGLDANTRERLVAEAGAHDVFSAAFTAAGTFTYEPSLHAFTFRYEVRESGDDPEAAATERAREAASAYLDANGIGYTDLTIVATDMASNWAKRDL